MRNAIVFAGLFVVPAAVSVRQGVAGDTQKVIVDQYDPRLARLQQFFAERACPLGEVASEFLVAADRNDLDWRLLPSISIVESSGGKDFRNNNVFGWDSCRESFPSVEAGIHFVASRLANSKLYKDKDLDGKLSTYNPLPDYPHRVRAVMQTLEPDGLQTSTLN